MSERICAVIVTYFPDSTQLQVLVEHLQGQVDQVLVVDNSDADGAKAALEHCRAVEVVSNRENRGIAVAHNQGIQWAAEHSFTHVLLMDQDSLPEAGMVAELLATEKILLARGKKVAAVGPRILDAKSLSAELLLDV